MERLDKVRLTRRDMLKLGGAGAGVFALTASGFAVPRGFAGGGGGGGSLYIEAFPTSPLIVDPFRDTPENQLVIPQALRAADPNNPTNPGNLEDPSTGAKINATDMTKQDCGVGGSAMDPGQEYYKRYGKVLGTQSVTPKQLGLPDAIVYKIDVQVARHKFTTSKVQPINSFGKAVTPPGRSGGLQDLPDSTIYGFNGTFPGPRINALYGQPSLVHFCNHLDELPAGMTNADRQDFGAPN